MVTMARKLTMDQQSFSASRRQRDLCGPYLGEETGLDRVRCYLQIADRSVAVDVPAELIRAHRFVLGHDQIVLRVPGEAVASVEVLPILTEKQQRTTNRWIAEMEDFDRF